MITKVRAFSSWRSAPTLLLSDDDRAESDLIQIRGIEGLDPIKATVNTSPYGAVDGASYVGTSILTRNIVLTLHPNPDWNDWTFESLRRLIYSYFMSGRSTRLVFESDDMPPVEISGIVEDVGAVMFSKDPEFTVSIICPDPYFTALEPIVFTGQSIRADGDVTEIEYNGTIEAGITVSVTSATAPNPTDIGIQIGDPLIAYFAVFATVDPTKYVEMSSVPLRKFVQSVAVGSGVITSLLSNVHVIEGGLWPTLQPGVNEFAVVTDQGVQDWALSVFERFGGL